MILLLTSIVYLSFLIFTHFCCFISMLMIDIYNCCHLTILQVDWKIGYSEQNKQFFLWIDCLNQTICIFQCERNNIALFDWIIQIVLTSDCDSCVNIICIILTFTIFINPVKIHWNSKKTCWFVSERLSFLLEKLRFIGFLLSLAKTFNKNSWKSFYWIKMKKFRWTFADWK